MYKVCQYLFSPWVKREAYHPYIRDMFNSIGERKKTSALGGGFFVFCLMWVYLLPFFRVRRQVVQALTEAPAIFTVCKFGFW
jgi:hypothetical protein